MTADPAGYDQTPPPPIGMRPQRHNVLRSIMALLLREMSSRYGRSPGGYVWALMEPVAGLAVMSIFFAFLLRSPSLGNSFILFYASAYLTFLVYSNVSAAVQSSIKYSKSLLMYPAVTWVDAMIARFLLNLLTSVVVLVIVFFGVLQFTSATAILDFGPMILSVVLMALLGFGHGVFNCVVSGLYPIWGQLWGIVSRPLFLIAGIFYIYEDLPDLAAEVLWYTPWIHLTAMFRSGVFITYEPNFISVSYVLAWALIPMVLGLLLMRRYHQVVLLE